MKILKLLNNKYLSIITISLLIVTNSYSEDQPVDIWNTDNKGSEEILNDNTLNDQNSIQEINESNIYNLQLKKKTKTITIDESLDSGDLTIIGLYDPEDYGLKMDMWINSNGDQLKSLFSKLMKIDLSEDANEIMHISILTNAYLPKNNITKQEFLKLKSDWLIRNSNLDIIEEYLIKNQIINLNPELAKYLVDEYLSSANIKQACELFFKNLGPIDDKYLTKFNIYCLIDSGKKEEAQLVLDLKREQGFKDKYFEKKTDYLLGYTSKVDNAFSEKSVLDFHLAYKTNPEFIFEPNDKTNKIIWKYLSSYNLLNSFQEIQTSELDKISTIEKADRGTEIVLHLRDDETEFLDEYKLRSLVSKYSDHISIPVEMYKAPVEAVEASEDAEGNKIGRVTSGTMSPSLDKAIGMGYVPRELMKADSEIYIAVRKKLLKAKVVRIPFLK